MKGCWTVTEIVFAICFGTGVTLVFYLSFLLLVAVLAQVAR